MARKNKRVKLRVKRLPSITQVVTPHRMDIWFADLREDYRDSVQGGTRPVLVISNDICNRTSSVITVMPLTTVMKHMEMPTHVVLDLEDGERSLLLAEQITSIPKKKLFRKIGVCDKQEAVEKAVSVQLGLDEEQESRNNDTEVEVNE